MEKPKKKDEPKPVFTKEQLEEIKRAARENQEALRKQREQEEEDKEPYWNH